VAIGASPFSLQRDGALQMAGKSLKCGTAKNILDPRLPNLGLAAPGVVVFNPHLLEMEPNIVRLFVFHHECGHHHVGGDELKADCWAVDQGTRDGWLNKTSLATICKSFGNMPATSTHPASRERCAALSRCFVAAAARHERATRIAASQSSGGAPLDEPRLLRGPTLVRSGYQSTPAWSR